MKEESVCLLSLSRHVTPWVFSSLKSCISHYPPSPWVTEWIHSCTGEKGGRSVFQWLLRALFPVPQPLFLTKTCQTVRLKGTKGRVTFLYNSWYAHLCGSVLVLLFSFIINQTLGVKTSLPPTQISFACLFWSSWVAPSQTVSHPCRWYHSCSFECRIIDLILCIAVVLGWSNGFVVVICRGANDPNVTATPILAHCAPPLAAHWRYCTGSVRARCWVTPGSLWLVCSPDTPAWPALPTPCWCA